MADNTGMQPPTRQSTGLSTRTSSVVSFQTHSQEIHRRQSHAERLNEILENARERAETMGAGTASPKSKSPRTPGSPVPGRHQSTTTIPEDDYNSAEDETTGIVSRGSGLNYNSVSQHGVGSIPRTKSRLNKRRSQTSVPSDAQQQQQPRRSEDMHYTGFEDGIVEVEDKNPWWKSTLQQFQSIELENKGSVARDHLAIERTFLAWLRTSLAFASIGIAVTQLFRLNTSLAQDRHDPNMETLRHMGKPLGATFLGISILILFLGYKRYFQSQEWVMRGKFPASRGTVTIVAFVALAIMIASLIVVIAIQPADREL